MAKLFGIGIGPGDPELITLKARRILGEADCIFVPQSKKDAADGVAYSIIKQFIGEETEVVYLYLPMTKDREKLMQAWREAAETILSALADRKMGAFVTLGDCLLYSTYSYILKELQQLSPTLEIENIPGITSFAAAASVLSIPLAEGEENLVIIPALNKLEELPELLRLHQNVVFLKVSSRIDQLVAILEQMNLINQAVFVSKCGHADQKIIHDLSVLTGTKPEYLSLILLKK